MMKIEEKVIINNKHGLHARPAALFVQTANKYDSSVKLCKDSSQVVDGKSIISILSLGANAGSEIKLIVEGEDAQEAFLELKKLLEEDDS